MEKESAAHPSVGGFGWVRVMLSFSLIVSKEAEEGVEDTPPLIPSSDVVQMQVMLDVVIRSFHFRRSSVTGPENINLLGRM